MFCHGLLGFDFVTIGPSIAPVQVTHWRGIKEVLETNGTEVLITRVPATSSVADRAKVLEEKISTMYPGRNVHLIGHSMVNTLYTIPGTLFLNDNRAAWTADILLHTSPIANFEFSR